jgi:MOSC domain-containing protein YiiM
VAGLYVGHKKGQAKHCVSRITLTFNGIEDDAHAGHTSKTGPRQPGLRRGMTIANTRQISLVSTEELQIIADGLSLPRIDPGWLAANIAITGFGPITQLPLGTIVRASSGASIFLAELNSPCRLAAQLLVRHGGYTGNAQAFVKRALGPRGLVGFTYSEGDLSTGDALELLIAHPEQPKIT